MAGSGRRRLSRSTVIALVAALDTLLLAHHLNTRHAAVAAFIPPRAVYSIARTSNNNGGVVTSPLSTKLFYTDDPPREKNGRGAPQQRVMTIPVLGPIPGGSPLVVGEDFVLEEPTPMQWQLLEEAMHNHRQYLQDERQQQAATPRQEASRQAAGPAGIDAAPLIAFMDDVTSLAAIPDDVKNSKYATIAAVVGISTTTTTTTDGSTSRNGNDILDTSSNTGFMESLMRVFKPEDDTMMRPLESKIRLVGIGRAALSDFHSRLPSAYYEEQDDDDGYIVLQPHHQQPFGSSEEDDSAEQQQQEETAESAPTPIVMAQFRLLSDSGVRSKHFVNTFGRSNNASPVHALNEMNSLSNRITSLHEDRKRLVRGLQAAKARLAVASVDTTDANLLEDHDGLGMLSGGFVPIAVSNSNNHNNNQEVPKPVEVQDDIVTLLNNFPADRELRRDSFLTSSASSTGLQNSHARLLAMENFGMGVSSASFSKIPRLTRNIAEKLQPYYSPEKQESEEHYYEVFSFMGVLSLSKFVQATDLDWALKSTNTIERMQWIYWSSREHDLERSIVSSMTLFLEPFLTNALEEGHWSCTASGFTAVVGVTSSSLYNAALSIYFYLVLCREWNDATIARWFERPVHALAILVCLPYWTGGIFLQVYNASGNSLGLSDCTSPAEELCK